MSPLYLKSMLTCLWRIAHSMSHSACSKSRDLVNMGPWCSRTMSFIETTWKSEDPRRIPYGRLYLRICSQGHAVSKPSWSGQEINSYRSPFNSSERNYIDFVKLLLTSQRASSTNSSADSTNSSVVKILQSESYRQSQNQGSASEYRTITSDHG